MFSRSLNFVQSLVSYTHIRTYEQVNLSHFFNVPENSPDSSVLFPTSRGVVRCRYFIRRSLSKLVTSFAAAAAAAAAAAFVSMVSGVSEPTRMKSRGFFTRQKYDRFSRASKSTTTYLFPSATYITDLHLRMYI